MKDNRDPRELGQAILDTKKLYPHLTASQIADGQMGVTMTGPFAPAPYGTNGTNGR